MMPKRRDFINRLMGKNSAKLPTSITCQDKTTSNNQEIANKINEHFSRVGDKLGQDVQSILIPFIDIHIYINICYVLKFTFHLFLFYNSKMYEKENKLM